MTGTLINTISVIIAGIVGTTLGHRLPAKVRETALNSIGLMTILIGLQMALEAQNLLVVLGSLIVGGAIGEVLDIEGALEALGRRIERAVERFTTNGTDAASRSGAFTRAFVTASLVFCVGPMSITGAIQDGLTGDFSILAVKSMLDGFTGLAFASTLGIGVVFAGATVLVYQGAIALAAAWLSALLTDAVRIEMIATGGLLIVGIGLNLLEIKRIRVSNLLPAVFLAPIATGLLALLG